MNFFALFMYFLYTFLVFFSFFLEGAFHASMNMGLVPFTGRNYPLLSVASVSDLLHWTIVFALAAQAVHWFVPANQGRSGLDWSTAVLPALTLLFMLLLTFKGQSLINRTDLDQFDLSEMMELTAKPNAKAHGYVVEAQMEPGMGPTANFIVRDGTLKIGDGLVCGAHYGKVKSLMNENGERIKSAGPSTAVKVLGMNTVPDPTEPWKAVKNDREARKIAEQFGLDQKAARETAESEVKLSLDDLFAQAGLTAVKELPVIIKADAQGSVEAIRHNLLAIESEKVNLKIIEASVGNVSNKDVMKASAGNAVILGFHTGIEAGVSKVIKKEGVEVRLYSIIYELIDQVAAAMKGLLEPEAIEESLGKAEVRASFPFGKKGRVAGCLVQEGRMTSDARVRIIRRKDVIYEGSVVSLRRYKDQVKDVPAGQECGVQFDNFNNIEEKDIIEAYKVKYVEQEL